MAKKKQVQKDYWTFDEFSALCKGKSEEERAKLTEQYNKQHGIDPNNLYPPDVAMKRFNTVVRAALFLPPADEEERALRESISKEWDRNAPKESKR
jgi:hypothetical protein